MPSKNVETLQGAHESWNRRDFQGVINNCAEGLVYTDHGRSLTLNTRDEFKEWTQEWAKAFSDGRITNPKYIDAGDIVVTQFTVEGTNDGPLGSCRLLAARFRCRSVKSVNSTNKGVSSPEAATTISTHC
jgi:hypothetical protein